MRGLGRRALSLVLPVAVVASLLGATVPAGARTGARTGAPPRPPAAAPPATSTPFSPAPASHPTTAPAAGATATTVAPAPVRRPPSARSRTGPQARVTARPRAVAPLQDATPVLGEDFESGAPGWTPSGFWHLQDHPETVSVSNPAINPTLVTLPDAGQLPAAFGGTHAAWFGEAATGTFCGANFATVAQTPKNGCTSSQVFSGDLVSPSFSLAGASAAQLHFQAWWEIESVDADRFDLMQVSYSTDGGSTWVLASQLNPTTDPNGQPDQSFSAGGIEQTPQWLPYTVDLSAAAGQPNVRVRFTFNTADNLYQGFRGWLLDDVRVDAAAGPDAGSLEGGGSESMPHGHAPCHGEPVNCLTGEFWHTFEDVTVPGRGLALDFNRTYSSLAASRAGPLGPGWTFDYNPRLATDAAGRVTVTEENGATVTFSPAAGGGFTAPSWIVATLVKNADGTFTLSRKDQTHYTFSAAGQLRRETDRNGLATTLAYSGGQLATVTDPAGRQLTLAYDGAGRLSKVTDPAGRTVTFAFDVAGNLQSATDVAGGVTSFAYDADHRLLTMKDPNGGVVTNVYDSSGRVTSQTDALGRKTTFSYVAGTSTTITDPNGNVEVEQFQSNLLTSRTLASGTAQAATWTFQYDPVSLGVARVTDPNQHVTQTTWDARGNRLSTTDALNRTTSFTYDALNDLTSSTDPLNLTTTQSYDANGNLLQTSRPLAGTGQVATTTLTYGDSAHPGDVTAVTDADGKVTKLTYDQFGNVVKSVDPLGDTRTMAYDLVGRMTSSVSAKGNAPGANPAGFTTTISYNAFGNPLVVTDPLGRKTSFTYDANRNRLTVTDGNDHTTTTTYDADNEPTVVTRADGSTLRTGYDGDGNVVTQTDGLNHTTSNTYDALNRLTARTDPLGRTTTYAYDAAGRLTSVVDAQHQTTSFAYDAADQRTSITYSDGKTPNVSFAHDADGRRTSMTDGSGTTTYSYDSLNRLTRSVTGAGAQVSYDYNLRGLLTGLTYPGGAHTVTRGYDDAGRLTSVTDWLGHTTTFAYDPDGKPVSESYPNGTKASFTYDADDDLTAIADSGPTGQFLKLSYTRDAVGDLTAENASAYSYDSVNRLTGASVQSFSYDAADRLTSFTDANGDAVTDTYDAADELTSSKAITDLGSDTTTYTYDARGNQVSAKTVSQPNPPVPAPTTTYGYDQANRLTAVGLVTKTTSVLGSYAYDGDGLRMRKTVSGTATAFTWDLSSQSLPVIIQDGTTSYVNGPGGLPIEQVTGSGTVTYYHQDQLGSTRALTNATGGVVATYTYDPYGNLTGGSGSASNPFRFAGQYLDTESGLYYLRARYYNSTTGQFLTRDPAGALSGSHYAYASDSPTNLVDPAGLFDWHELAKNVSWWGGRAATGLALVGAGCAIILAVTGVGEVACAAIEVASFAAGVATTAADITLLAQHDPEVSWVTVALDVVALIPGLAGFRNSKLIEQLLKNAEVAEKLGSLTGIIVGVSEGRISISVLMVDLSELADALRAAATRLRALNAGLDATAAVFGQAAVMSTQGAEC
jgi:RHS repeat-associated protein